MKVFVAKLKSMSPYGQSRAVASTKSKNETHEAFEERTWREKVHQDKKGSVFIPPMAFKNCIQEAAKYKSIQIPGKGKSTYTKHFKAGILVMEPLVLPIKADAVPSEKLFVPSDGIAGSGKRVWKTFPIIHEWSGDVEFVIVDDLITLPVFKEHLEDAGKFIGIGRFRPINGGYYGRFAVESVEQK